MWSFNTPQIIFYSLLKWPLLGYEPKHAIFVFVPLNANELVLQAPFQKRVELQELMLWHNGNNKTGQSHALKMSETLSPTWLWAWQIQAVDFTLLSYAVFHYHNPIYDHSGSTWRQHQWKQAETMVALASLALKSAKKLFQKGNLENKIWRVIPNLSGAEFLAQSVGIDPSFRINLCENPVLNWPSFVRQSGIKWLA